MILPTPIEREFTLQLGRQNAVVSNFGASLRRYWVGQPESPADEAVWGYSMSPNKKGGQGDVLIPFPGRVRSGTYEFDGRSYQMKRNDKDGPNAIHGFLRTQPWQTVVEEPALVRFRAELGSKPGQIQAEGYPFELAVELEYRLEESGLVCEFVIHNQGAGAAPVGAGFHPYFQVGTELVDEAYVEIPAREVVEFGPDLLPTGRIVPVQGGEWDFRGRRRIGGARFNHCYTGLVQKMCGRCEVRLENASGDRWVRVWMEPIFEYLVIYTGDTIPAPHARRALAIEPMTCATDAFNRKEWGLRILDPGQSLTGRFGVQASASDG